jgi:hypothetical protein
MEGPYAELSLRHLLLDIARDDFHAVGITATDHRDRLFLVEQLRRHAPGVQILLVGGDLAFDHPAHRQAMLGALVVSAYPPFLAHHLWPVESGRAEQSLAPPTQANSALVNAVTLGLEMVRRPPRRDDRDEIDAGTNRVESYNLAESRLRHYDAPNPTTTVAPSRPPLWISTIGYQGAWPLQ